VKTNLLPADNAAALEHAVTSAVRELAAGQPVALPTETVYGLAADALQPAAVARIFEAKERPFFDPLIVHLPDRSWLERIAVLPEESRGLIEALIGEFWPGPLTLVLPRRELVPDLVTAGLATVAVRMSAHPVFRAVIERFGGPLAAPSANRFGRISPTAAAHVASELDGRISLILDGGPTEHGLESTIVKVEGTNLKVLRAGPVPAEALARIQRKWRESSRRNATEESESVPIKPKPGSEPAIAVEAPGQLKSHYAPRTPLTLGSERETVISARRLGLLAFRNAPLGEFDAVEILSASGDLREAAATLFAKMRRLDEANLDLILAEFVPEEGLGIAIMDRLRKAAAEHDH
jgi:L-threonylcarbamoyladenylate synthase